MRGSSALRHQGQRRALRACGCTHNLAQPTVPSRAARSHPFGSSSRPIQRDSPAESTEKGCQGQGCRGPPQLEPSEISAASPLGAQREARPGCGGKLRAERPCSTPFNRYPVLKRPGASIKSNAGLRVPAREVLQHLHRSKAHHPGIGGDLCQDVPQHLLAAISLSLVRSTCERGHVTCPVRLFQALHPAPHSWCSAGQTGTSHGHDLRTLTAQARGVA